MYSLDSPLKGRRSTVDQQFATAPEMAGLGRHVVLDHVRNELVRARPLPFAGIEGDALSHAKLLRSLFAKGLEPPGIRAQIQLVIHCHL
jgi:hypothetical protein